MRQHGGIDVRRRLVGVEQPSVQTRLGAGRDDAADRPSGTGRGGTPRRVQLLRMRPASDSARDAGSVTPRSVSRWSGIAPGEHVSRFSSVPCGGVEIRRTGQHRVTHRRRQVVSGPCWCSSISQTKNALPPVTRCSHSGSTAPLTDEPPDRVDAERGYRQRACSRGSRDIAEQHAQRVADTDFVVADDADDERPRLRDASQHEPQEVDGALVGPVQIVEHENRRRSAQVVVDGVEDVVGRFAFAPAPSGGGRQTVSRGRVSGRAVAGWAAGRTRPTARVRRSPNGRRTPRRRRSCPRPTHRDTKTMPATPRPRVVGPGPELAELMIALGEHHEVDVSAIGPSEQRRYRDRPKIGNFSPCARRSACRNVGPAATDRAADNRQEKNP